MRTRALLAGVLTAAGTLVLAPFVVAAETPVGPRGAYTETTLLFGTQRPEGGTPVTAAQFQRFLDTQVTTRFPAGLTVDDGRGQYRDRHGVIERERSYRVVIVYPTREAESANAKLEAVRSLYDRAFRQESVGRLDESVHASFS
ncbi:DUF3574 domain-containing protein [Streptomyces sp. PTM05]|uniref:DUF3574 domain-containing protein n=1 Tax=Streptantibioticus parmotrematis TaxID=2873249 RepID=A0ABS7R240_9ACTN|nr:DUF3574 domain-containing protein [Streptantibioticus parmotrematis]MBY8888979.1 DUF3574 domain-containing protein [Streptantibioticus parmotrematis]